MLNGQELEEEEKTGSVLQMGALCSRMVSTSRVVRSFRGEKLCKRLVPRKVFAYLLNFT